MLTGNIPFHILYTWPYAEQSKTSLSHHLSHHIYTHITTHSQHSNLPRATTPLQTYHYFHFYVIVNTVRASFSVLHVSTSNVEPPFLSTYIFTHATLSRNKTKGRHDVRLHIYISYITNFYFAKSQQWRFISFHTNTKTLHGLHQSVHISTHKDTYCASISFHILMSTYPWHLRYEFPTFHNFWATGITSFNLSYYLQHSSQRKMVYEGLLHFRYLWW